MKVYKLIVTSDMFKSRYDIQANNISDASAKAKAKFANDYHIFANLKVSLDPEDLPNHIEEILKNLCNS